MITYIACCSFAAWDVHVFEGGHWEGDHGVSLHPVGHASLCQCERILLDLCSKIRVVVPAMGTALSVMQLPSIITELILGD
jgi:hypothetical protein